MTYKPQAGMTDRQIKKELDRVAVAFEEKCLHGSAAFRSAEKFETVANAYMEHVEKNNLLRPRTVVRMKQLEPRTFHALGHIRIDKITTAQVQSFIDNLAEPGVNQRTGGGLSAKSQKHYLSFVSDVFEYAIRLGMATGNPCEHVDTKKLEHKEHEIYTLDELQALLDALQADAPPQYFTFFMLAAYTGLRRAELLGLEWSDIDFKTGVLNVSRTSLYTKELGQFTDTTKTKGSQRALKLPESVLANLKAYKAIQAERALKCGDQWHHTNRLFTKWNGEPMNSNTPYNFLLKFCREHGLRFIGVHGFRHTNASLLIASGADVKTVSENLGHSQVSTTLDIYSHSIETARAAASDAVSAMIDGKRKVK